VAGGKEKHSVRRPVPQITIVDLDLDGLQRLQATTLLLSDLHVWQFPLDLPESAHKSLTQFLSVEERARAAKFHFERDARRFSAARATVRTILAAYVRSGPHELQFAYAEHGKPSLARSTMDLRFSVSHSGEIGLLGLVLRREVGIDVEVTRDNIEIDTLAKRFFSVQERESLHALPTEQKTAAFFRCWTFKEAFLKAQGVGLSRSLVSFDVDLTLGEQGLLATRPDPEEAKRWSILPVETAPGYTAAVAVEGSITALNVFRCH
jgi:4'-phosphopantetheinyl transferase